MTLRDKIVSRKANLGVIGLGYVGLPLALEFAQAGFTVTGLDVNEEKVQSLKFGHSYVEDISSKLVAEQVNRGKFKPAADFSLIKNLDAISICVPTPLRKTKDPDTSFIVAVVNQLKRYLEGETLIILESTTYPGTTEELIQKVLEETGLRDGEDFYLCFSPERVDPGNKKYNTRNTPKVLGSTTLQGQELGQLLYGSVLERVVPVSSTRVAETVKLLENTFRSVNIALVNEMAMMCERMGIDIWEVIEAASTKPFGFMPFYPGPGIGGHCIPLDPMYLSWKAKTYDFYNKFIDLASDVNGNMPRFTVNKIAEILNEVGKPLKGTKVLILGMSYKSDIGDLRESPGLELYRLLEEKGAAISYNDPYAGSFVNGGEIVNSVEISTELLQEYDCVVLSTGHSCYDYGWIADNARLILDTRNAFKGIKSSKIYKLGAPLDNTRAVRPLYDLVGEVAAAEEASNPEH